MDPLSITASIIAILKVTTTLVSYANDIKDAPKDRARFAMEASSLSSLLIKLRFQIEDERRESSNEAWTKEVTLLGVPDGPLDQYKHALENLQLKIVSGKGLVKIGNALWWKFTKEEVAGVLLRIERLKSLIQIALQMDHFILSQAIKTCLGEIQDDTEELKLDMTVVRSQIPKIQDSVDAVQDSIDAVQRDQERQKNQMLVEWISSANYSSQQSDFIARREPGTGQWFLDSPEFKSWLDGGNGTLFCPGIPGAGKTMVSAIAVDYLHTLAGSGTSILPCGVTHIFCNYKTQSEQNTTSLLSAILKQLVQANPSAAKAASILYQQHCDLGTRPSLDEIFAALKTTMMSFGVVYVVIDALDECTDQDGTRTQFLAKLRDLQQEFDVRLMVTSRDISDIVGQFKSLPTLEIRASPSDVKRYVRGQVYRLPRCVQRDEKLQGEVEDKIVEAVDGMFLLARLHVDSLRDKRTNARVQSTLEMLPKGKEALKEAYNDAIKRLETQLPDDSKLAKLVLSWITYAERPLTTGELCHALAVECGDTDLNKDNILDVEDIVSVCAGLVTVDEESNIIRLVHYTTQEYFLQIREDWNPTAQQQITTTCLTYLSFGPFRSGSCDDKKSYEKRTADYAFLDYASIYWGHHALTVQDQVSELAFAFLRDSKLISCTIQAKTMGRRFFYLGYIQTSVTGVHLTAGLGLQYLLEGLLLGSGGVGGMAASATDGYGREPLTWAAREGHTATMKLLVERDDVKVNINTIDFGGETALLCAAKEGHEAAVILLLGLNGVDANSKDEDGRTPLSWASYNGHRGIAELLMEREGVEIDARDKGGSTPFLWAILGSAELTVRMFLERNDIDFNAVDSLGRTPLSRAAQEGSESIVRLLLENGDVQVDKGDFEGRTPLSYAAERGNAATVKLLVERADVNADSKDSSNCTPLWWAADGEDVENVKLLIEREDVDANAKDTKGRTALLFAVAEGENESIIKLFLEREDVEADAKDKEGQTALMFAAQQWDKPIVKLLLEREDVEADAKDKEGRTALMFGAQRGNESIVKLFLEREDVEADAKDEEGRTALMFAAQGWNDSIVKLFLDREDVEADAKDKEGRTALMFAAKSGVKSIVKLLLEREDVEANAKDKEGRTALMFAAQWGDESTVKLFLEREDVEADAKDTEGRTALMFGAQRRNESIVKLFLEREDVEADAKDTEGRTALMFGAQRGNESIVKLLFEREDVNPTTEDCSGLTALSYAETEGHKDIVELLKLKLEHS